MGAVSGWQPMGQSNFRLIFGNGIDDVIDVSMSQDQQF